MTCDPNNPTMQVVDINKCNHCASFRRLIFKKKRGLYCISRYSVNDKSRPLKISEDRLPCDLFSPKPQSLPDLLKQATQTP